MSKKIKIPSEGSTQIIEKAIAPVRNSDEAVAMLQDRLGSYPLYVFLLYSEMDEDIAEFLRTKGNWLHNLSGEDCLIGVFENPANWGEAWQNYWRQKLGSSFDEMSAEWMNLKPLDRNTAYSLADKLDVHKNVLPCIVFIEDFSQHKIMYVPMVRDKNLYQLFFPDLFDAVHEAIQAPSGSRLDSLRPLWRKIWVRYFLPRNIEHFTGEIKKWGSIIKDTEDIIAEIITPVAPILRVIKKILAPIKHG